MNHLSRREALGWAGISVAGLAGAGLLPAAASPARAAARGRGKLALRFAHLTDSHVQPELAADVGWAQCLQHVQSRPDKIDLILTGGDLIMDSFEADAQRTRLQWGLFTGALKRDNSLPVFHTLGNHDIWGWNKSKSSTSGSEAQWGKKWATDTLGLAAPYHSHQRAGWKFIHLDSVAPRGDTGYFAKLDEAQLAWLKAELDNTPKTTPIVVISHIPILSITALFGLKDKSLAYSPSNMHEDGLILHQMFAAAGNVKLCLSGHIHLLDRTQTDGVTYICDGAVSGSWWKGTHGTCPEGYGVVELFDDSTFAHQYIPWGWKAREA